MEREPGVVVGRSQKAVRPGMVIADKYRVQKELGRGGFGVVVRAVHLAMDQIVAIKILTVGEGGEAEWKEDAARFKREAQATAALRSEYVVRMLDADFLEDGSPYMVMEYLEGETLHHAIHTRGPLPIAEAVDHVVQVLAALGEAHAAGIVHRDLKPANVLITSGAGGTPVAKVLDFGVSKIASYSVIGSVTAASPLTRTGAVIGTIAYMAPEQMIDAKRVDARADLWSVGVLLYELLTKQTPFGPVNNAMLVTQMLTKPPIPISSLRPDIPPKLEKIVMRCLEKTPDRRYATAGKVAAALAEMTTRRARPALESLRRTGRPTAAAAPIEKGAPALLKDLESSPSVSGSATASGKQRTGKSGQGKAKRRSNRLVKALAVVAALVTVALIGLAVGIFVVSGRLPELERLLPAPGTSAAGGRR